MADQTEDGFKVVDRRPFTAEGELRREVVEEQEVHDEEARDQRDVQGSSHGSIVGQGMRGPGMLACAKRSAGCSAGSVYATECQAVIAVYDAGLVEPRGE